MMKNVSIVAAGMVLSVVGLAQAAVSYTLVLADNFNTAATWDQNADLAARQTGSLAGTSWVDFNYPTTAAAPDWDSRVRINANGQLELITGNSEMGLWIPGLSSLPRVGQYRLSFDLGSVNNWTFAAFTNQAGSQTGFYIFDNTVRLLVDGTVIREESYEPAAEGLHRFVVAMDNGVMTASVDDVLWTADLGVVHQDIGYFYIYSAGSPAATIATLDNFKYEIAIPEPATLGLFAGCGLLMAGRRRVS